MNGGTANITNSTVTANFSTTGLTGGINAGGECDLRSSVIPSAQHERLLVNAIPNFTGTINRPATTSSATPAPQPNTEPFLAQPPIRSALSPAQANLGRSR